MSVIDNLVEWLSESLGLYFLLRELEGQERRGDPLLPASLRTFRGTFLERGPS